MDEHFFQLRIVEERDDPLTFFFLNKLFLMNMSHFYVENFFLSTRNELFSIISSLLMLYDEALVV